MEKYLHIQGDTLMIPIDLSDENGDPINITGATLIFTMSKGAGETPVLQKTCTIINALLGQAQLSATNIEMSMDTGLYYWEIQMTGPSGDITTSSMSEIEILPQLTTP